MKINLSKEDFAKLNFSKLNGLVPAIIQDAETLEILMLGFMNQEAFKKTIADGKVTFFSRSKKRLWQKGETSGNFLKVVGIETDCDNDSLLIFVKPEGVVCHKGTKSCFGKMQFGLMKLYQLIRKRKKGMPKNSYTTSLFSAGFNKIVEKIEEESAEVVRAATLEGKQRLIEESCDLIYHLFVLLNNESIDIEEVEKELERRNEN